MPLGVVLLGDAGEGIVAALVAEGEGPLAPLDHLPDGPALAHRLGDKADEVGRLAGEDEGEERGVGAYVLQLRHLELLLTAVQGGAVLQELGIHLPHLHRVVEGVVMPIDVGGEPHRVVDVLPLRPLE